MIGCGKNRNQACSTNQTLEKNGQNDVDKDVFVKRISTMEEIMEEKQVMFLRR